MHLSSNSPIPALTSIVGLMLKLQVCSQMSEQVHETRGKYSFHESTIRNIKVHCARPCNNTILLNSIKKKACHELLEPSLWHHRLVKV